MTDIKHNYLNVIPGLFMGFSRSIISHPFEILKIKSQLNIRTKIKLYKGIHYSIISSGVERGIQFYLYDYFREANDSNLLSSCKSSSISTFIGIPYNFYIVNKSVTNQKVNFTINNLSKTLPLEYTRCFLGSTIFLYTYNELKDNNLPLWFSAFCGTTTVWGITYPIDNIRNQIISNKNNFSINNLYKGVHFPILRSLPSSIIGMWVYEKTKKYIDNI
jgi:hypothetical protein